MNTFIKFATFSLLTTLAMTNIFAAADNTKNICKITKTATISATDKNNKVGLDYETFTIKQNATRKDIADTNKQYEYGETIFIFTEPNLYLTPKHLNSKRIKEDCLKDFNAWKALSIEDVEHNTSYTIYEPVFLTNDKKYLVVKTSNEIFNGGAHGFYGYNYIYYDTETQQEIKEEQLLKNSFKDKNYAENSQLSKLVTNKIKQDKEYYQCLYDEFKNGEKSLYFPPKVGIEKNAKTNKKNLVAVFSLYEIAPYVCGMQEIIFTKQEINPFLKTDSVLYKILND